MDTTQVAIINEEIKSVIAIISDLVLTNASSSEIDLAQKRLQRLLEVRKDYLYSPHSIAYYIEQIYAEPNVEGRQQKATELEGSVINTLLQLYKETSDIKDRSIPYENDWYEILRLIRYLKHTDTDIGTEEAEATGSIGIYWSNRPGLPVKELCSGLVAHKWLDSANASLLEYVLENPKEARERRIIIDWDGSKKSLTTFLLVSHYLGILNPANAKPRSRDALGSDGFEPVKYPTPPIADIISHCFICRGKTIRNSDISRHLQKDLIVELDAIKAHIEFRADEFIGGFDLKDDPSWEDALAALFAFRNYPGIDCGELVREYRIIDFSVLRFLDEYVKEFGIDRKNVGPEMKDFS